MKIEKRHNGLGAGTTLEGRAQVADAPLGALGQRTGGGVRALGDVRCVDARRRDQLARRLLGGKNPGDCRFNGALGGGELVFGHGVCTSEGAAAPAGRL